MKKNQNTSLLQHVNQKATKFRYYKLILASLFFTFSITATQSQGIPRDKYSEKWVAMFIDPALTTHEQRLMRVVMEQDRDWYMSLGYYVYEVYANDEAISSAILDGRVKSIAYYEHGCVETPTIGNYKAIYIPRSLEFGN